MKKTPSSDSNTSGSGSGSSSFDSKITKDTSGSGSGSSSSDSKINKDTSRSGSGSSSSDSKNKKVSFAPDVDQIKEKTKVNDVKIIRKYRVKDIDGIEKIFLRSLNGASVKVRLYGGQVVSWMTNRGDELLFTSSNSLKPPNPLRGGIQVCFPHFGKNDRLNQHGFARNKMWETEDNPPSLPQQDSTNNVYVDLLLKPTEDDLKNWPHKYELRLRVALSDDGNLTLIPRVRNIGTNPKPCVFTFAFHTYFLVSDISEVRVEGMETLDYLDNLKDRELCTEQGDSLTFESEIDRIYKDSDDIVTLYDHEKRRSIRIKRKGLPDIPVWNPWEKKEKTIPDFGKGDYKRMVCVGGAAVDPNITLALGQEWTGRMVLEFVRGS